MAAVEGLGELHLHLVSAHANIHEPNPAADMTVSSESDGASPGTEPPLPGFTSLTDQIYVQDLAEANDDVTTPDPLHPDTVMIFGWGDARPKHVAKYVEGYRRLFPHVRVVLVFSPILRTLLADLNTRTRNMAPVVGAVFPDGDVDDAFPEKKEMEETEEMEMQEKEKGEKKQRQKILAHVMSNTGGINYAATLNAHLRQHGRTLPHDLVVLDSTPGSVEFFPNVGRWSRAMAIGAASYLPVPFAVAQAVAAGFLGAMHFAGWLVGRVSAAEFSVGAANNPEIADLSTRRLYLYSKEDDIIHWKDIEAHAAEAVHRGFAVDAEIFDGTPHVGHMRQHPDKYWDAIAASWKEVVGGR